jgi:hypothetical protein
MGEHFWIGFEKRAYSDISEIMEQAKDDERVNQPPPMLARTISKAGPVLADLTEESDRAKFRTFRG